MVPFHRSISICLLGFAIVHWQHARAQETWRIAYGGFADDRGTSLEVVNDDLILVAGSTGSFGAGSSDIYLMAINAQGDRIWSTTIGGAGLEQLSRMRRCANGDLIMVGTFNGEGSDAYDGLYIRTDQLGQVIWQRTLGDTDWDFFHDVKELPDGGFILAGETFSFGEVGGSAWVVRTSMDGDVVWMRTFEGSGGPVARSVDITPDNGFIFCGALVQENGDQDALVMKLDGAGVTEWVRTYGGDSLDIAHSIIRTSDGGYSFAGSTRSFAEGIESYHVKLNGSGEVEWAWSWGGFNDQETFDLVQLATGEYLLMGYSEYLAGSGRDMYMQKSWINGAFVFGRAFGGLEDDVAYAGSQLNEGFICAGHTTSFGSGASDIFVVRSDIEGLTSSQSVITSFDPLSTNDPSAPLPLALHPNPSAGSFRMVDIDPVSIRLFDAAGRVVELIDVAPGTVEHITSVPSGAYLVEAVDRSGVRRIARLLVVRP